MITTGNHSNQNAWLGAAWKVAAFACYAGLNGIARYLSGGHAHFLEPLPVYEIVFFQDLFALFLILPWFFKEFNQFKKSDLSIHLLRGLFSGVAVISWYFALFYLPLADAVAISVVGPVLGVMFARIFLRERLNILRFLVIGVTFGIAFYAMQTWSVIYQQQDNYYGLLLVLFSAFCFAMAKITTRALAKRGTNAKWLTISLLFFILPVSLIPALVNWTPVSAHHFGWLMLAGALTVSAIYCVSQALVYAEITFLAPFDISRFIFNSIVGYFAFTELPTAWALVTISLMFCLVAWQLKRARSH